MSRFGLKTLLTTTTVLQQQGVVATSTGFGALVDELRIHLRRDTA